MGKEHKSEWRGSCINQPAHGARVSPCEKGYGCGPDHAVNHVSVVEMAGYPPVLSPRRLGTVMCLKWCIRKSDGTYYGAEAPCCDVWEAFLLPLV